MEGVLFALGNLSLLYHLVQGMITYASYAPKMTIKSSAISIVVMNILVSQV